MTPVRADRRSNSRSARQPMGLRLVALRRNLIRLVIAAEVILCWSTIYFGWGIPVWVLLVAGFGVLLALGAASTQPRSGGWPTDLYASDPASDIELGRRPATYPVHESAPMVQIAHAPESISRYDIVAEPGIDPVGHG